MRRFCADEPIPFLFFKPVPNRFSSPVCQDVDRSTVPGSNGMRMAIVCWIYFMSKFTEFCDTFFFIARKKFAHVSMLQVGHSLRIRFWIALNRVQNASMLNIRFFKLCLYIFRWFTTASCPSLAGHCADGCPVATSPSVAPSTVWCTWSCTPTTSSLPLALTCKSICGGRNISPPSRWFRSDLKRSGFSFTSNLNSVTSKSRQMSMKLPQNDFTRKIKDFDTFTKIA